MSDTTETIPWREAAREAAYEGAQAELRAHGQKYPGLAVYRYEHVRAVVRIAVRLAELTGADTETVEAAAWLHDTSKAHSSQHGAQGNHSYYSDPQVDAWLEAARVETDAAERIRLYRQAEKKIVADAPWLFLAYARNAILIKPYVHGVRLGPMDSGSELPRVDFSNVWLDPVP